VSGVVQMERCLACLGAAVAACLLLAAWAGPVPDYGAYRHAALSTATAMISSLATAELAVQNDLRGRNLFAFTDDTVTNAENDAGSVNSTFGSRQPPDGRSLALSQRMDQALSQGTSALSSLRIAVRQNNRQQMITALAAVGKALRLFRGLQAALQ
jgi:hypothetical protein